MKYKIFANGIFIAQFANEHNRDICMDCLKEEYNDCAFAIK